MVKPSRVSWFELETSSPQSPPVEAGGDRADVVICGMRVSNQELISPDGEECPPLHYNRLARIISEYRAICRLAETVFPIVSGYRSYACQSANYTSGHETHCKGYALDIAPVDGWTVGRMSAVARMQWHTEGSWLRGIGIYPDWLHIDVRPRSRKKLWFGTANRLD